MTTHKSSMAGFIRLNLTTWIVLFIIGTILIVTAPGSKVRVDHRQPYSVEKIRITNSGFSLTNFDDKRNRVRRIAVLTIFGLTAAVAWIFFFGGARYPNAFTALMILSVSVAIFSALTAPGTKIRDYLDERKIEKMWEAHPAAVAYCQRNAPRVAAISRAAGYRHEGAGQVREAYRCMKVTLVKGKDYIDGTRKGLIKFLKRCKGKNTTDCRKLKRFDVLFNKAFADR